MKAKARKKPAPKPGSPGTKRVQRPKPVRLSMTPDEMARDALEELIQNGRGRHLAETLPQLTAASARLGDAAARILSQYVAAQAKKVETMTGEQADRLMAIHQGAVAGVVKAHDTIANSPQLSPMGNEDGRTIDGQVLAPVRQTRLSGALGLLEAVGQTRQ